MSRREAALELIEDLRGEGYDNAQIKDFLEDGQALSEMGITDQALVEDAWEMVKAGPAGR